jgi:lambda repressor-like predicted transcriptional regulator
VSSPAQRAQWRAAASRRSRALGAGQPLTVEAKVVRRHLAKLRRRGSSLASIADTAGVSRATVYRIWARQTRLVLAPVAEAITAVTPASTTAQYVDATGTRRRLQALFVLGYSGQRLADMLGVTIESICEITTGRRTRVLASTAQAAQRLHDQLWNKPPAAATKGERISISQARSHARRNGWPPSAAWDDDTIDDPKARPAGVRTSERAA